MNGATVTPTRRVKLTREAEKRKLAVWSAACAQRVLHLFETERPKDRRVKAAIDGAHAWARGDIPFAQARNLALAAHAAARAAKKPAAVAAARAAGHAVATAHSLRHAKGGSLYALKALTAHGGDTAKERAWQKKRLPRKYWNTMLG